MVGANARLGNIVVPYDWTPTGAPIARGQTNTVPAHADYDVYRTPFANYVEGEPGAVWKGQPYHFNPNGVVMDYLPAGPGCASCGGGLGDAAVGANMITSIPPIRMTVNEPLAFGPTVMAVIGGVAGAGFTKGAPTAGRVAASLVGALAGGILGVIFSPG